MRTLLLLTALTAACGSASTLAGTMPAHRPTTTAPAQTEALDLGGMDDDGGPVEDQVEPGDILTMRELGGTLADPVDLWVDRTGRVHLPLFGSVAVAGLSLESAEGTLTTALQRYDRFARATLVVKDPKGHTATVLGLVNKPGPIPLIGDPRLADVLSAAGGPRIDVVEGTVVEQGSLAGARVFRTGHSLPVSAERALLGDPRHNVRIRPRDYVYVPAQVHGRILVLGHVGRPRAVPFRPGLRLTDVLAEAGGLARSADTTDVRILRGGYRGRFVLTASLRDLMKGQSEDPPLEAGDIVYVGEKFLSSLGEVLERVVPLAATGALLYTLGSK